MMTGPRPCLRNPAKGRGTEKRDTEEPNANQRSPKLALASSIHSGQVAHTRKNMRASRSLFMSTQRYRPVSLDLKGTVHKNYAIP